MKSEVKSSFVKQATILAIAALLSRFLGFLYRVPLTNLIGNEGNGIYSNGYYIYTFFLIMSSAGLPVAISKMVSTRLAEKNYRNAHQVFKVSLFVGGVFGLISCLVMIICADFFSNLINSPKSALTLITLAPTILIVALMSSFRGYFQGMGNSVPTAFSQLIEQIFNAMFSIGLAIAFMPKGVDKAAAGATAATGIGALAGFLTIIFIYYLAKPKLIDRVKKDNKTKHYESNKALAKEILYTAMPIIVGTAVFSMTNIIDMVMVKNILVGIGRSQKEAETAYGLLSGKYNVLVSLPISISTALATAALPSVAASHKLKNNAMVEAKINSAMRITMLLSIPSAVGIGVLGDQIIKLLYPLSNDGGILLTVGSVSIVFLALTQISTGMLQATGNVKIPAIAAFMGALVKIPVNFWLISRPGIEVIGAILGTTACYIVSACIDLYYLKKTTKIDFDFKTILFKPLFASTVMGLTCYTFYHAMFILTNSNTLSIFISIAISVMVYFIILIFIKGISEDDLKLVPLGDKMIFFLKNINAM